MENNIGNTTNSALQQPAVSGSAYLVAIKSGKEAALAYNNYAKNNFGEFANLNIV